MRHKISLSTMFVALGLAFSASVAMAADEKEAAASDGRATMLSYTCAGCHGTNGVSHGPAIPTIAGLSEDTFTDAMNGYKDDEGGKNPTIMDRIAKGYSDEDIAAMAGFFSKQTFVAADQAADATKAAEGQKIHEKECSKCHEEGGTVDVDGSGILAGQWKPYLHYSLNDAVSGARAFPKKMTKKVQAVHEAGGDDAISALLEYYASQK